MGCSMYVIIYLLDLKYEFFYLDNDIIQIPLAIVIIGSLACTFFYLSYSWFLMIELEV